MLIHTIFNFNLKGYSSKHKTLALSTTQTSQSTGESIGAYYGAQIAHNAMNAYVLSTGVVGCRLSLADVASFWKIAMTTTKTKCLNVCRAALCLVRARVLWKKMGPLPVVYC